jgi:hypothetical protein
MNRTARVFWSALLMAPLLVGRAVDAGAQQVDRNRIFDLTVQVEGQIFSTAVREGDPLRLTVRQTDEYRLVPVLQAGSPNSITVAVYRGVAGQEGSERLVERVNARMGTPASLRVNSSIQLVLDAVRMASGRVAVALPAAFTAPGSGLAAFQESCCVCCAGACACACGVKASCGQCCMGECCKIINETSNSGAAQDERIREARIARLLGGRSCPQAFPAASPRSAQVTAPAPPRVARRPVHALLATR